MLVRSESNNRSINVVDRICLRRYTYIYIYRTIIPIILGKEGAWVIQTIDADDDDGEKKNHIAFFYLFSLVYVFFISKEKKRWWITRYSDQKIIIGNKKLQTHFLCECVLLLLLLLLFLTYMKNINNFYTWIYNINKRKIFYWTGEWKT